MKEGSKSILHIVRRMVAGLVGTVERHRFALAAFLIPLTIRAIPEIIAGPYPIGWDTIASYVPNTLDWAAGKAGVLQMLGTAPLMYMISVAIYLLLRLNPVWIFKVMGPMLYGSMILALYRLLRKEVGWNETRALGGALLTSLYFVTLRISWDLYRNMLGLTFLLLMVPLLAEVKTRRVSVALVVLTILTVASDQLPGVIALSLVGATTVRSLVKGRTSELSRSLLLITPGVALFSLIVYGFATTSGQSVVSQQPPLPNASGAISSIVFLGYAYWPIAPLVLLGAKALRNFVLRSWFVICAAFSLTPLLPFFGVISGGVEWGTLLSIPMCIYAAAALNSLGANRLVKIARSSFRGKQILTLFSVSILVFAALYVALPAERAFPYYAVYTGVMPSSLIQDSVPMSQMGNLKEMLGWVNTHMTADAVLITHDAIYGWARAYLTQSNPIFNYGFSSPLLGVHMANEAGYHSIYMIWWINGSVRDGQPGVPQGFLQVAQSGQMAVYTYE